MLILLTIACAPVVPPGPASPGGFQPVSAPTSIELIGGAGDLRASAWVRSVNGSGASVPADPVEVLVDGHPRRVELGATGYGQIWLETPGVHIVSTEEQRVEVVVYGVSWPGIGGMMRGAPAPFQPTEDALSAGEGVLLRRGEEVWWTSYGERTHRVLSVDQPVLGMRAGLLDIDDISDAIVWTSTTVFVLRGVRGGGMMLVAELQSTTHHAVAATLGDATNDGLADLVIVWEGESDLLDIWTGDGFLSFEPSINRPLLHRPIGVAVGDGDGSGKNEVTVSEQGGGWERFYWGGRTFNTAGPNVDVEYPELTRLESHGDLNGDGAEELLFVSPPDETMQRTVTSFDLEGQPRVANLAREPSFLTVRDLNRDGLIDLVFSEQPGNLVSIHSNGSGGLTTDLLVQGIEIGPVSYLPATDELFVASEARWLRYRGEVAYGAYTITDTPLISPGLTIRDGLFAVAQLDATPAPEVFGLRAGPLSTVFRVWSALPHIEERGQLLLDDTEKHQVDLAYCDGLAYVLFDDRLDVIAVSDPENPVRMGSATLVGEKVACGAGPHGPVAVLGGGQITQLSAALDVVATASAPAAQDLFLDAEGVATCEHPGCTVVRGPFGPGGHSAIAVGWPDGASINGEAVVGAGSVSFEDVDGDGSSDLLFHLRGEIVLYRNAGQGFGPAEIFHTREPLVGGLSFFDLDGDGVKDAWGVSPDVSRLRVTPPVQIASDPPQGAEDTGDVSQGDTYDTAANTTRGTAGSTGDTGSAGQ